MANDILESFGEFEGDDVINETREHLEPEELKRLFRTMSKASPKFWHPFFFIMYQFGCRVSEVRIIKKEAISLPRREIVIYRLKKKQWDRSSFLTLESFGLVVEKNYPGAVFDEKKFSWHSGGVEIAKASEKKSGSGYTVLLKNKSKGFKRFIYTIDDNMMKVLEKIYRYNEEKGLSDNNFLFPALKKRRAGPNAARMVAIGRLGGDNAISRTTAWRAFKEACEKSDIPTNLRNDHVLRHTRATLMLADGVPEEQVQYLLGHENISTTRGYLGLANSLRAKYQVEMNSEMANSLLGFDEE
ncbi:MAG: site-specific integrase [Desulfuromusa sp.]|nr:site-specific integrase [Desulfuromusa sp.]